MSNEKWNFDSDRFEEAEANPLQARRRKLLEQIASAADEIAEIDHRYDGQDPDAAIAEVAST